MLAHVYEPHRVTFPCWVQPKFNGVRALCGIDAEGRRRFQSREELPWNYEVLEHLSDAVAKAFPPEVVLDGELYVHRWPLQRISGAVQIARTLPRLDTIEIQYMIFDAVNFTLPFEERFKIVKDLLRGFISLPIHAVPTIKVSSEDDVNSFYVHVVDNGFEGIMYRLGDCPYTRPKQEWKGRDSANETRLNLGLPFVPRSRFLSDQDNRTWHLLKRKAWQDGEFLCVDVEEGVGKRNGLTGAFVCEAAGGRFRVGSGLTDAEAAKYLEYPMLAVGHKIKVKFLTLTQDGIPFNPTFEAVL